MNGFLAILIGAVCAGMYVGLVDWIVKNLLKQYDKAEGRDEVETDEQS